MSSTPAGWYPDFENPAQLRYWDGRAWTDERSAAPNAPGSPSAGGGVEPFADFYRLPSLDGLSPEQRKRFMDHRLKTYPIWLVIVLHFVTFGLFTMIYQGLNFSRLPQVRHDDFGSGKGIGFMFIPFYALYWTFRYVHSLIDRVNFQLRLRDEIPRVNRGLGTTSAIFWVLPYFGVFISYLIFTPIVAGQVQSAVNELARERKRLLVEGPGPAVAPPPG